MMLAVPKYRQWYPLIGIMCLTSSCVAIAVHAARKFAHNEAGEAASSLIQAISIAIVA
jgi:hypothetical protein